MLTSPILKHWFPHFLIIKYTKKLNYISGEDDQSDIALLLRDVQAKTTNASGESKI
jgi:hypothetical protein